MTLTPLPATDVIAVNVSPGEHVMVCSRAALEGYRPATSEPATDREGLVTIRLVDRSDLLDGYVSVAVVLDASGLGRSLAYYGHRDGGRARAGCGEIPRSEVGPVIANTPSTAITGPATESSSSSSVHFFVVGAEEVSRT